MFVDIYCCVHDAFTKKKTWKNDLTYWPTCKYVPQFSFHHISSKMTLMWLKGILFKIQVLLKVFLQTWFSSPLHHSPSMCAENIERLRASFTVPPPNTLTSTTTTGSSEEINYSQGGRVGLQARVHTSSMGNYLGERRKGMRWEEGSGGSM